IDETPELFQFAARRDRATKLLSYIGDVIVNGHPEASRQSAAGSRQKADAASAARVLPTADARLPTSPPPKGTRDKLKELGPERFAKWLRGEKRLFVTDTTMRDAH